MKNFSKKAKHKMVVQLIAPASKTPKPVEDLLRMQSLIESWGLIPKVNTRIFGEHPCDARLANTDALRFEELKEALSDPDVDIIWCVRGGYGVVRLLPMLEQLPASLFQHEKLFIGFSDATLLHLYLNQKHGWKTLHAPPAFQAISHAVHSDDIECLRAIMLGEMTTIKIDALHPMNLSAEQGASLESTLIGGNLSLLLRSMGLKEMSVELSCKDKILFFEDVEEPFRKIDGMLYQLECAGFFDAAQKPRAVIVGECSHSDAVEKASIKRALHEFAERLEEQGIPVLSCPLLGHHERNQPLPIGTKVLLHLGRAPTLNINV